MASARRESWRIAFVIAFNALVTVTVWIVVDSLVQEDRQETIRVAIARNDNLAIAFEQYVIRTIESTDATLKYLIFEVGRHGATLDLSDFARNYVVNDGGLVGMVLVDEHGDGVTTAASPEGVRRVNLADREHFRVHENRDTGALFLGKPVQARLTGKVVTPITKRINKRNGAFGGVAMALIEPGRFTELVRDTDLSSLDIISVVGLDGVVRSRRTGTTESAGEDIGTSQLFTELANRRNGHYFAKGYWTANHDCAVIEP